MGIPVTDRITATFGKPYIKENFGHAERFHSSLTVIETGIQAGKIWNQEFLDAKSWVASGCEHAQHISSGGAHTRDKRGNCVHHGDCRDNIGYAFTMNQAAKMSRDLKKLQKRSPEKITPGISEYVATLDQIDAVWKWLQSAKPLIVKGRKPSITKTDEQIAEEMENTGHCAICERRQKLSQSGEPRTRTLVHHGYEMSDYNHSGNRMGKCFGAFKLPYEVSCLANRQFKVHLEGLLKQDEAYLVRLNASEHDTLTVSEYQKGMRDLIEVPYARGTAKYEQERQRLLCRVEYEISMTKSRIAYQTARIDGWVPTLLYDEKNKGE